MSEPLREVAAAILIGTCGRFLLQQRDDVPGILYPGLIGLFGGHREGGETFLECVRREVHEEIGLALAPERFEPLARFVATFPGGGGVTAHYFVVRGIPIDGLVVTEGSALPVEPDKLGALLPRMTPTTAYAVRLMQVMATAGPGTRL